MDERQMTNMRRFSAAQAGASDAAHLPAPAGEHATPSAGSPRGVYTFLPLDEAVNPSRGGLFAHYVGSWWIVHPEKGLAFYHAPGRPHGRGSPQCNTAEGITRMILAKTAPFPGAVIRYIESAWVPADPGDY